MHGAHDPGAVLPADLEAAAAPLGQRVHRPIPGLGVGDMVSVGFPEVAPSRQFPRPKVGLVRPLRWASNGSKGINKSKLHPCGGAVSLGAPEHGERPNTMLPSSRSYVTQRFQTL